jgi:hypothetical protein
MNVYYLRQIVEYVETLSALPRGPMEPAALWLSSCESAPSGLQYSSVVTRTLSSPRGIRGSDVLLRCLPASVHCGRPMRIALGLVDGSPYRSADEVAVALESIALHTRLDIVHVDNCSTVPLNASVDRELGGVVATVLIPRGVPQSNPHVCVRSITVAGTPIASPAFPLCLRVFSGIASPLRIKRAGLGGSTSPVVTARGILYVRAASTDDFLAFDVDGTPLPPLQPSVLGLYPIAEAAFDEVTDTLLLADSKLHRANLAAIDATHGELRWVIVLDEYCQGIAVLSAHSIAIVGARDRNRLRAFRLADGICVASIVAEHPSYVAADPINATVFVCQNPFSLHFRVSAYSWDGAALHAAGVVHEPPTPDMRQMLLAVMPSSCRSTKSHLIICSSCTADLRILSLPDRRLVHTHTLEGMLVCDLAADPSGTALVVCDLAADAISVLPWPLPGMPTLL